MSPPFIDLSTGVLLSQAANSATHSLVSTAPAMPPTLNVIDWTITAAGAVFAALIGVRRLRSGRFDGFFGSPVRVHGFREDAVLAAVLAYLLAVLLLSALMEIGADKNDALRVGQIVNGGAQLTGIAVCLWIASKRFAGGIRVFVFGGNGAGTTTALVAVAVTTIIALAFCPLIHESTVWTIVYFAPSFEFTPHATIRALQDGGQPFAVVIALWIGAALIAPVAEELFFRGILQSALVNLTQNRPAAIVLASAAFGAVHTSQPDAIAALVFLGLLLGYVYERTGALVAPIAVHAAFNLKTLIWDALGRTLA